jgi:hypothetical protein
MAWNRDIFLLFFYFTLIVSDRIAQFILQLGCGLSAEGLEFDSWKGQRDFALALFCRSGISPPRIF